MKKYLFVLCLSCFSTLAFSQFTPSGGNLFHVHGDVGIGIGVPAARLHVLTYGGDALKIERANSNTYGFAIGGTSFGLYDYTLGQYRLRTSNSDLLLNEAVGNVGIGTAPVGSKLHLKTYSSSAFKIERANSNLYGFEIGGGTFGLYDYTLSQYKWRTNNTDLLLNEVAGNVGIGTITPSAKLDVNGTTTISGLTTLNNSLELNTNNAVGILFTNENASHGVGTKSNTFRLVADSDGDGTGNISHEIGGVNNVLTNLNSNSYTINVKTIVHGDIESSKIRVSTNPGNWPDYVFESSYKLKPLDEVEAFINKNQHLPEVPSAKEVEANGLDLGDMDATLLKKMEELTLYMIELNKTVKAQEDRIKQLETENKTLKKKTK